MPAIFRTTDHVTSPRVLGERSTQSALRKYCISTKWRILCKSTSV